MVSNMHNAATTAPPLVSAVICTRNRGARILSAVESLLANTYPHFELVIIDQSSDDRTAQALGPFYADPRLCYLRSDTQGVGLARSLGLRAARAELVMMTDDDCEVPPDWLEQMTTALQRHPDAAIVFCDVDAAPHDPGKGWILVNQSKTSRQITNLWSWCAAGGASAGIGAGMALRRTVIQQIGDIDAYLGAGGHFRSGWETDISLRVLLHGYTIYRTNTVRTIHFGFRTHEEGRVLMRRYMFGIAAVYAKLLKCGHLNMLPVMFFELWRTVIYPGITSVLRLRKPQVVGRALALVRGALAGFKTPVDHQREVYLLSGQAGIPELTLMALERGSSQQNPSR